jgi:hypothetical protein
MLSYEISHEFCLIIDRLDICHSFQQVLRSKCNFHAGYQIHDYNSFEAFISRLTKEVKYPSIYQTDLIYSKTSVSRRSLQLQFSTSRREKAPKKLQPASSSPPNFTQNLSGFSQVSLTFSHSTFAFSASLNAAADFFSSRVSKVRAARLIHRDQNKKNSKTTQCRREEKYFRNAENVCQ